MGGQKSRKLAVYSYLSSSPGNITHFTPQRIEIAGSWRIIYSVAPDHEIASCIRPATFFNGFIHCVAFQRIESVDHDAERFNTSILAFDVKNEIFHNVMLPKALVDVHTLGLSIWKETSIGIVDNLRGAFGPQSRVWVMKEYGLESSWTKLLIVKESQYDGLSGLVACRKNGELVLTISVQTSDENFSGGIVSHDTETHKHRNLRFWWKEYIKCVCSYMESLTQEVELVMKLMQLVPFLQKNLGGEANEI